MPCPKCDGEPFLGDYDRDFVLTSYHVNIAEPADFQIESEIETILRVDGDIYRVGPLTEESPDKVRKFIRGVMQESEFEAVIDYLPHNSPRAYDEDAYLSRHLPLNHRSDLKTIAEENGLTPRAALLLAFVESKNQRLGKADDTLTQYVEVRDSLANNLDREGGVTPGIQREFVAHLLLATALIEELAAEALFHEIYREEYRLGANRERLKNLTQGHRLNILTQNGIVSESLYSKLQNIKQLRDSLVHDARRRTAMQGQHDKEWLDGRLEKIDEAVAGILNLSGKTAAGVIAENGPRDYVVAKCEEAVREAKQHWQQKHHQISLLEDSSIIEVDNLRWHVNIGSTGNRTVTEGADLHELPTEEDSATTEEIRLYNALMEFCRSCEDFLLRRIERDLEQANLDRQDFLVLCLLCAEENSHQDIAKILGTTVEYVQRKENVLAWRSSGFEKDELGDLPKPDKPIEPFDQDGYD